ncbi:MAG: MmcQ/YjbR family DNA-binding protein [Gaiellales bacterium]
MDAEAVRRVALALPEVEQYDHGGLPAFRVRGKRFASMLDAEGVNLMLDEAAMAAALALWPDACSARYFAGRLAAVRVSLGSIPDDAVRDLLEDAWARRAPKRLVDQLATSRRGV